MHAQTPKQDALRAIERFSDDAPVDDIAHQPCVPSKIMQGLMDIGARRTVSTDGLACKIEA